ncbi:MAG TPA: alpha/beta hydrolase, partial [Phenylobacterium sp.]|nr:alpha/beta hydrolase [Phenylobacterium sp.]
LHLERRRGGAGRAPLLYVHGGTFPSALSVNWGFDEGRSWSEDLAQAGHDVWSFDFLGFGRSARYPAMAAPPAPGPLGRSDMAVLQMEAVVAKVRSETGAPRISLLAHSWGGVAAGRFAAEHPDRVDRLVLFAPICRRDRKGLPDPMSLPGWAPMPLDAQWKRFVEDVPLGEAPPMTREAFDSWGRAYLATDPSAAGRSPPAVAIPTGPQADIAAAWQGSLGYEPSRIAAPVTILRGEWDSLCNDEDARWLRSNLARSSRVRDVRLPKGTHLMLLESGRGRLWAAAREALA